ncbi:hypothetical protein Prudu_013675 [Prunus dulcis]|uniref:Man1/Src1-like C-terminal domain-containing protein n=1 Tax=Prunus dulcis TaxID=3755 RepID=A0A4Y1RFI5_PRUDU|nr:hypothetical protein Prudu_013675 [Prunus dulcis]
MGTQIPSPSYTCREFFKIKNLRTRYSFGPKHLPVRIGDPPPQDFCHPVPDRLIASEGQNKTRGQPPIFHFRFSSPPFSFLSSIFLPHSNRHNTINLSMSSTSKKRPKPKPKPSPESSLSSIASTLEPSQNFFPSKEEFSRLTVVLAIAASVALTLNFLSSTLINRHSKPFCDSSLDSLDFLPDSCDPCPSNGQCYQARWNVFKDLRSVGSRKGRNSSLWALAEFLCYGTETIWLEENDIWNDLDKRELLEHVPDNAIYMYTKERTMETVNRMLDTRTSSRGVKELKCPDMLAEHYKPFSCCIRQWISEHALLILPLVGSTFILWKLRRRRCLSTRVDELYQQVCEVLEEKAFMSKSVNSECEPWVVASRLRDRLLLPKERKDPVLWKKVEELVQEDSHVDCYPKLVKGESKVVWEWQGSLSSSRRMRRGEDSKLKSSRATESSEHHLQALHADSYEGNEKKLAVTGI